MQIVHLLWEDDLVLVSDSEEGLRKQLNGLFTFCEKNIMIVYELKTKVITFGCKGNIRVFFNGQQIETTSQYKYYNIYYKHNTKILGVIFFVKIMITYAVKLEKPSSVWNIV